MKATLGPTSPTRRPHHEAVHEYRTTGDRLDLASWGPEWFFGQFDRRERSWCTRAFQHYGRSEGE